jgi:LysR family hydrogen peroxide-inducible transcriptional activator
MNIQQLEYIISLDKYRHFVRAAEACGVSQPTLSSLIHKLEEELDVTIFDRTAKPIVPTSIGRQIIDQAKVVMYNLSQMKELALNEKNGSMGSLHIGVIPTVAPYVLPRLFSYMHESVDGVELRVSEMRTSVILDRLKKAELDMAILATPLEQEDLLEIPLYYEKFMVYVSPTEELHKCEVVDSCNMPADRLWVLQEGHCMRGQVFNFCNMQTSFSTIYEAGSIDTLVKIVDANGGYTVIPELHFPLLNETQKRNVRPFISPAPLREISLVIRNDYVRERLVNVIVNAVKHVIPVEMIDARLKKFAVRL